MKKYIDMKESYNKNDLEYAANLIKNGELVLFPTETVYGIGADGLNENAVKNIFLAKGRKQDNPLILHVSSIEMIKKITEYITPLEMKLIETFFPGPLTIILKKNYLVPNIVTGNLDTVGIRMPENTIAHDLIELSNTPIAAPSANISGKPSGTNIEDIFEELNNKVSCIIDGGDTLIGLESTVIRVINDEIHILRPGKITEQDLKNIAKVDIDEHILNDIKKDDKILSPGMKYKHYAPNTKCILVYSKDNNKLINKIKDIIKENPNSIVLSTTKNINNYNNYIDIGNTLEEISHNIFKVLREVDKKNVDLVIIEGVESTGLGLAIMNRLIRACSHNYIEI